MERIITSEHERVVTLFGSSRVREGSVGYREAYEVGRLLAECGFSICNGGSDGTMEASARGAKSAGGRTIGVSVGIFPGEAPNHWLDEEVKEASLFQRLDRLTSIGDAFLVLRGGVGTLVELAVVWNLTQANALQDKPVVLLGDHWRRVFETFSRELVLNERDVSILTVKDTPREAVTWLAAHLRG